MTELNYNSVFLISCIGGFVGGCIASFAMLMLIIAMKLSPRDGQPKG